MSKTLFASIACRLDVKERADPTLSPASDETGQTRTYDQYSIDLALSGNTGSFPEIGGDVIDLSFTLGGTTKDFDLTAAPWAGDTGKTVDKTGKKLVAILIVMANANNAAGVTFGPQGANGYALFGAANVPRFYPGTTNLLVIADPAQAAAVTVNTPAVAAGAKDLRFTGTAADSWKCLAIFSE